MPTLHTKNKLIVIFFIFFVLTLPIFSEAKNNNWQTIIFQKPYKNEHKMILLIEYAFEKYEMTLIDNQWTVELKIPEGIYHYTYWNPKYPKDWSPLCNNKKSILAVGFEKSITDHFKIYYKGVNKQYLEAISKLLETGYEGYRKLFDINLIQRIDMNKINVFLNVHSGNTNNRLHVKCKSIWLNCQPKSLKVDYYVYGFIHELGHLAILFGTRTDSESVADVLSNYVISNYVWPELGLSAWPELINNYNIIRGEEWSRSVLSTKNNKYANLYDLEFGEDLWKLIDEQGAKFIGKTINSLPYKTNSKNYFYQKANEFLEEKD